MLCKTKADWSLPSLSLPTCGQWCRGKSQHHWKGITHYYYSTICMISETLAPQHACFSWQVSLSDAPPPLFFCSTSIRVVLDCRVRAQCSLWLRGGSQTLSHFPVETRIGEDMRERETERKGSEKREEGTFFFLFFFPNSANIFLKPRRAVNETGRVLAGSWPND